MTEGDPTHCSSLGPTLRSTVENDGSLSLAMHQQLRVQVLRFCSPRTRYHASRAQRLYIFAGPLIRCPLSRARPDSPARHKRMVRSLVSYPRTRESSTILV